MVPPMNIKDPRVQTTGGLVSLACFAALAGILGGGRLDRMEWIMFILFTVAAALTLFTLIREVWKPRA